jgi:hypothetical protein
MWTLRVNDWPTILLEIPAFGQLKDGWDGEGTVAPSPDIVRGALDLGRLLRAEGMRPPDRITAGVNGTLHLEWHGHTGYFEVEVTSGTGAESYWVPKDDSPTVPRQE